MKEGRGRVLPLCAYRSFESWDGFSPSSSSSSSSSACSRLSSWHKEQVEKHESNESAASAGAVAPPGEPKVVGTTSGRTSNAVVVSVDDRDKSSKTIPLLARVAARRSRKVLAQVYRTRKPDKIIECSRIRRGERKQLGDSRQWPTASSPRSHVNFATTPF
ncbi:unnamed protein product [Amoebophrya sp. A25]|nr:unnamed protein product [Amoebophrya sp. A25]|eukprot:GSA25T00003831001.1